MTRQITREELDAAIDAGVVRVGRVNRRPVRCMVQDCGQRVTEQRAWRLIVDGHGRGFICWDCWPPGGLSLSSPTE